MANYCQAPRQTALDTKYSTVDCTSNLALNEVERIQQALSFISPIERDTWLRIGMAIKSAIDDSGFDIWDTWSQQADSYNNRDARDVWKSIRPDGKITLGTLFYEAKTNGWKDEGYITSQHCRKLSRVNE